MTNVTELLRRLNAGDDASRQELFSVAYPELRKLARSRLRNGGRNTYLETTALVHESFLRVLNSEALRAADRRAFFAFASSVMRSVIVDAVRERRAGMRGGGLRDATLDEVVEREVQSTMVETLLLNDTLLALEATEPRMTKVVEMRYFCGYTDAEIADLLDVTERTVRRDWARARLLLMVSMRT